MIIVTSSFTYIKLRFKNAFHPHESKMPAFSNSSGLTEERFLKAPFS